MTMSIFPVHELDWALPIFKPLRLAVNAGLAHELSVWQKQGHESEELLRGAEAAQRLQRCRRVCRSGVALDSGCIDSVSDLRSA
jgi:hypothetical protein